MFLACCHEGGDVAGRAKVVWVVVAGTTFKSGVLVSKVAEIGALDVGRGGGASHVHRSADGCDVFVRAAGCIGLACFNCARGNVICGLQVWC